MEAIFLFLYDTFRKRRFRLFLLIAVIFAVTGWLASRIRLEEDISRMISGGGSNSLMGRVVDQSKFLDKIIFTIASADSSQPLTPDELIAAGDRLADTLQSAVFAPYVRSITYKVSDTAIGELFDIVYNNLPLFLAEQDYERMDSLVQPENIRTALVNNYRSLLSPAGFTMKQMIIRDPVGIGTLALGRLRAFQNDENYTLLNGCIFSRDRQHLMMFITPVFSTNKTSPNSIFVKQLDEAVKEITHAGGGNLKIEYFGSAVVAVGNAERLKRDIRLTLSITIILLALIINFSVKKKKLFPFIFLPAVFGALMALAALYLIQAKVSVISLSVGSVVLAITVDYALHITTHFKHRHSIINTIKDVSFPIIVCGFATAFEFLALVFVSSESLHELGILAAITVITAAFFTMVVMPHILDVTRSASDETEEKNYLERLLDKITNYNFHKNKLLLLFMVVFTGVALFYINNVGFETNMMKMNYVSRELAAAEESLNRINNYKLNSVYVVAYGNNLQEALISNERVLERADELKSGGTIKSYTSPSSLLLSNSLQLKKIGQWNSFWTETKKKDFMNTLEAEAILAGFRPGSFSGFGGLIGRDYSVADSGVFRKLESLFFVDNISVSPGLATIATVLKVDNDNKENVIQQYDGTEGIVVIDRKSILSQLVNTLGEDFNFIANVSLMLILLVLIVAFGRIELGVITFVPILVSWVWTLGIMGMFGIKFNIFNIIISSFITGLGIDYSIYIMQGLVQGYKTDNRNLLSYKTCILLSVMISISGTGVLILAKHPALNSIALISIIGLLSVVLISYTFEPILFNWLVSKSDKKRVVPVILSDVLVTIAVFALFIAGSLGLNLLLFVVILLPIRVKHKKYIMHSAMAFSCKLPVYSMLHVRKRIINDNGEDFSRPAVILSNHQSHIDLLILLMLHPKIIVLTNKWVWNNPIYALVIRYIDYYPVMGGYEVLTTKLEKQVKEGYSILVFPEGSRSPDSKIKRFHKGAFLLAENLRIEILPIIIHGAGDCMNKGENHLKGGAITIRIYPRIKPEAGIDYHQRTKLMLTFYRREHRRLREELETPAYFRRKLIRNYIYKGPVLEWYTRIKLSLEDNYSLFDRHIPRNASIADIGCGYGFMAYMLSFVSDKRQVLGIDHDADKIEMANHCISKHGGVKFVTADATVYPFDNTDVFILSDVLHYLTIQKQEDLLSVCLGKLNPGGRIIIRDADKDLEKRHLGTRYTEFFSTRTGFNKTSQKKLYFFSGNTIRQFASRHNLDLEVVDNTRLTSNIFYLLKK
ncbi:MAG TPA: 1-acyl-sn-glycerol-3-phosphate acyltransferase [Bacteroidales bacterium]|nr:1-acyl-sn-glycerol-3-phosphate acyltransferase [Bacteroidales bacterium]